MNESLTLSRQLPDQDSMNYTALRELGISRIQELAGNLWTDYNSHDPGITMLEVMCYAITDLGYRVNYDIQDIIAQELGSSDYYDIKNFYTAREIFPVCPVTFNDYRKIMIDVDVYNPSDSACQHVGVKNAWIEKANKPPAEHKIYVDKKNSKLSLEPVEDVTHDTSNSFYAGVLYDVLLELDKCDTHGDLNSAFAETTFQVPDPDDPLEVLRINLRVDFMRWDEDDIDWDAPLNLASHIEQIRLRFPGLASESEVVLAGGLDLKNVLSKKGGLDFITPSFLSAIIPEVQKLFDQYVLKVNKIFEILHALKKRLNASRNLCEDFYKFNALKVEEILLCADIELSQQADVETTEAAILHAISNFLSPTVFFYSLEERLNKCRSAIQYSLDSIVKNKNTLIISSALQEDINKDDVITLFTTADSSIAYTVKCIRKNKENPNLTDIEVLEDITSEDFDENAYLIKGTIEEELCQSVDKIFEGPKLKNGFIDDEELTFAQRRKFIHVSDMIRIIMDVEGVVAVKNIQIANRPQDNDANIKSKSVKWCLELAFEENYVPRLNRTDSKLTFYKDKLPFIADDAEVELLIDELEKQDRSQKRFHENSNKPLATLDIPVPVGEFKDLENYHSLQEDFPLVYGIGSEGIPGLSALKPDDKELRIAQARQLKGFLMFFDQLAANYLSQLNHVKDLFSMNGEKDKFGNFKIDKTYFSQALFNTTPPGDPLNLDPLYVNKAGHLVQLNKIVEDQPLYEKRRNKFLDHLLGRFAESFTDYALLLHKAKGIKADGELIEDKLNFLNAYPMLSSSRGKAINYRSTCNIWSIDNVAGLVKRASLLLGMEGRDATDLVFSPNFKITETAGSFTFSVCKKPSNQVLLNSPAGENFDSVETVKKAIEKLIINGSCSENFKLIPTNNAGTRFSIQIECERDEDCQLEDASEDKFEVLAESQKTNFTAIQATAFIEDMVENVLLKEFCDNHEANRRNLSMPINNYFEITGITANLTPPENQPPQYEIAYRLFKESFNKINKNVILSGTIIGAADYDDDEATVLEKGEAAAMSKLCELVAYGTQRSQYATIIDDDDDFKIVLCDNRGAEIGRSPGKNFNNVVTAELDKLVPKAVEIGTYGTFAFNNAINKNAEVEIRLKTKPPVEALNEPVSYTQSFDILNLDIEERTVEIQLDPNTSAARLYIGDTVDIRGSESNDSSFEVLDIQENGTTTILFLKQALSPDETLGAVEIKRTYSISKIIGKKLFIYGVEEEREIKKLMDFFTQKFASHEGVHLIEHTILRPRINEPVFRQMTNQTLTGGLTNRGQLFFQKSIPIESVDPAQNIIILNTDLSAETILREVTITGDSPNDGDYHYSSLSYAGGKTIVKLREDILFDPADEGLNIGNLVICKKAEIIGLNASTRRIRVADMDAADIPEGSKVIIWKSEGKVNDGKYLTGPVSIVNVDQVEIRLTDHEALLQDALLPVNFDHDCETCNLIDPYSCVVSVVLPYWPGRFTNIDIRNYIEKTIRTEAPAHLLLNICWVNCEHMEAFEKSYKKWLLRISKTKKDKEAQALALAELIESISQLRNIYPSGTLHSCDDDDTFEGSIILNNSVLGTF